MDGVKLLQLLNSILENFNILVNNDNFSQVKNLLWGIIILIFIYLIVVKIFTLIKKYKEEKDVPYKAYEDAMNRLKEIIEKKL